MPSHAAVWSGTAARAPVLLMSGVVVEGLGLLQGR